MKGKASLLKIYISETDKLGSSPLYEEIVAEARNQGLAGATVHRGILSFGASHSIHTMKIFALSSQLPVVVEIVDEKNAIKKFATKVNEMIGHSKKGALVTIQPVEVLEYKPGEKYNQFKSF
jgi:PII-like signaling protein